jgi:hypothetical protein
MYRAVISDNTLATLTVIGVFFLCSTFIVLFLGTESVLEGLTVAQRASKWVTRYTYMHNCVIITDVVNRIDQLLVLSFLMTSSLASFEKCVIVFDKHCIGVTSCSSCYTALLTVYYRSRSPYTYSMIITLMH